MTTQPKGPGRPQDPNKLIFDRIGLRRYQWELLAKFFPGGNRTVQIRELMSRVEKFWPEGPVDVPRCAACGRFVAYLGATCGCRKEKDEEGGDLSVERFDKERQGTGTKEWAETTFNIGLGCRNNCRYCYAANNAANPYFGSRRRREEWEREELTKNAAIRSYPAREGVVMFPSTHDITPFYLPEFVRVASLMLAKGNHLLITTKPRLECVTELCRAFSPYRGQVLFRFTIGSTRDEDLALWEPGAPGFVERFYALTLAHREGFRTSVSVEPMLSGQEEALRVALAVYPLVTETIWIGKMNKARLRCDMNDPQMAAAVAGLAELQGDGEIRHPGGRGDAASAFEDPVERFDTSDCGVICHAIPEGGDADLERREVFSFAGTREIPVSVPVDLAA